MQNNQNMVQQNNQTTTQIQTPPQTQTPPQIQTPPQTQTPPQMQTSPQTQTPPQPKQPPVRDPRTLGQYTVDKTFEAAGKELDRMEQEKPGTRRKVWGCVSLGATVAFGGLTTYFFTS